MGEGQLGSLAARIRAARALGPASRAGRVHQLAVTRDGAFAASVRNIAAALDRLGVAHG